MHIHHNPMTSGNAGIHSAAAAEKAAAAQRAIETRRKLQKIAAQTGSGVEGTLDAGELFMAGKWARQNTGQGEGQSPPSQQGVEGAEDGSGVMPISVWT
jgi:hypothetical protein